MKFIKLTPNPAILLRSGGKGDTMIAALITRTRFALTPEGQLVPPATEDQLEDMRRDRIETEFGDLGPDAFFPRTGTDLILLGDAIAAKNPVREMPVRVSAGPYQLELLVKGDRIWTRDAAGELVPSAPAPFTRIPLTYRNAYGGSAEGEYGPIPEHRNPVGKGFYLTADEALGKALPNIEDPGAPIRRWNDRPDPVGLGPYPLAWGLRLLEVFTWNAASRDVDCHPEKGLYDIGHPRLSGKRIEAGHTLRIEGMHERGAIEFNVPECPFEADVTLGERTIPLALKLEEVLVDLRSALVDLTYRAFFKYEFVREEKRRTTLRPKP